MLASLSNIAKRYFVLIVICFAGLGYLHPDLFLWINTSFTVEPIGSISGVIIGLGIIMLGMGMTLTLSDVRKSMSYPHRIVLGTVLQFLLMPALAFALTILFGLPSIVGVGIILVGCCPGGTASNVIAYLSRADVPLSVSVTLLSTILAPLLTPWLTWLYAQKLLGFYRGITIEVPVMMLFKAILTIVVPIAIGLFFKQVTWGERDVPGLDHTFTLISVLVIAIIVGFVVGNSARQGALHLSFAILGPVAIHNALGLLGGYWAGAFLSMPETAIRSLSIEVGMQNSGLAVALAGLLTSSLTEQGVYTEQELAVLAIPAVLFSVWHNITGPILASYWGRDQEKTVE